MIQISSPQKSLFLQLIEGREEIELKIESLAVYLEASAKGVLKLGILSEYIQPNHLKSLQVRMLSPDLNLHIRAGISFELPGDKYYCLYFATYFPLSFTFSLYTLQHLFSPVTLQSCQISLRNFQSTQNSILCSSRFSTTCFSNKPAKITQN